MLFLIGLCKNIDMYVKLYDIVCLKLKIMRNCLRNELIILVWKVLFIVCIEMLFIGYLK